MSAAKEIQAAQVGYSIVRLVLILIPPQAFSTKATQKELSQDFDAAFELHVKAAESFIHLVQTLPDATAKASCKAAAKKALERAEHIKNVKQDIRPVAANPYSAGGFEIKSSCVLSWFVDRISHTAAQAYIMDKSSLVNGHRYSPWLEVDGQQQEGGVHR